MKIVLMIQAITALGGLIVGFIFILEGRNNIVRAIGAVMATLGLLEMVL